MPYSDLDLTYNPFDDVHNNVEPTPTNGPQLRSPYTSTVTNSVSRRRSSFGPSGSSPSTIRKRHSRSRTEFNLDVPDPEDDSHPLRSAALRSSLFQHFEITRPHLSRLVQGSTGSTSADREQDSQSRSPSKEEKEVIVHRVTSNDSLAGVSIKYGITLSELRKANQLWTNDSIHLRKELLIPIDRANRAHEHLLSIRRSGSSSSTSEEDPYLGFIDSPASAPAGSAALSPPLGFSGDPVLPTIRKVPASQLSFFPPSANSTRSHTPAQGSLSTAVELPSQRTPYLKPSNPSNRTGYSPANSLTTLLAALPITASTRDEIVSRVSIDGSTSSYSDFPRSQTGSDEDMGHEMEDISSRSSVEETDDHSDLPPSATTPRPYFGITEEIPLKRSLQKSTSLRNPTPFGRPLLSTSPPSSYIPQQPYNPHIRTQQLEPSPTMQLPSRDLYRTVDSKIAQSLAHKSPYRRSTPAEPRNRAPKGRGVASDLDRGIELSHT